MALQPLRLRRALSLSFSLLHRSFHVPAPICPDLLSAPRTTPTPFPFSAQTTTRLFTSTTTLFRKTFDPEKDEIGPDTILFEGCDYNHWLITVDFPKDSNISREQMIETYVNLAAQIFGSVEEAKKKIYALSTTTYQGFQVECSEETSEKFKSLPGVVFVLPDSYIDPANKEYGGDKYVNGEIFPRPPPVQYARRGNRDRRPREQNYGPPPQQNQGPGPQQNYGPPPQQNYGPPPQQNYGPRPQQNYGPRPQQNYGPRPQQNYGPPPSQNYGPPPPQNYGLPQQNYAPPSQQNYAPPPPQNYAPPPPQNYVPSPQQNYRQPQQSYAPRPPQGYGSPPEQSFVPKTPQSYGNSPNFSPQQNYNLEGSGERSGSMLPNNASGYGERNSIPSYEGNFNQQEPKNPYAQGQRNLESNVPPEQRGFLKEADYGSSQGGPFEQVSRGQRSFSSNRE